MKYLYATLVALALVSCKSGYKRAQYSYLSDEMNQTITLSNFDYQALKFENSITGLSQALSYHVTKKQCYVIVESVRVLLSERGVDLWMYIRPSTGKSHQWVESTTKREREEICEQICVVYAQALSENYLKCPVSKINVIWDCSNGGVSGKFRGGDISKKPGVLTNLFTSGEKSNDE